MKSVMHVCNGLQVSSLPGALCKALGVFKVPAGEVLLSKLPEETLGERPQAGMHCSNIMNTLTPIGPGRQRCNYRQVARVVHA